ncbi:hypothetical protein JAAARDRAFT_190272 [Jaapia argillacea MUCL 33604]|uniref:Acyl-protein thioesterase 1 n=1 Tax=Jaapia argillacea MUCL 33604 TaxID=933084 RepID=A0A067Q381_9AGAM|nr:hypothetical protein JAAARDRAFT_190272 [Jaapia argillacea MUCL 33604]
MSGQSSPLRVLVIPPRSQHTATVVFCHGLGGSGYRASSVSEILASDPSLAHVKWILPFAPSAVTGPRGANISAWFNFRSLRPTSRDDEDGVFSSAQKLVELINGEAQISGIPESRIILGGISQGGITSLVTGLITDLKLGGIFVLSGLLIMPFRILSMVSPHVQALPIFWAHGTADPLIPFEKGFNSAQFLISRIGIPQTSLESGSTGLCFNSYDGLAHGVNEAELRDLRTWLKKVIA